MNFEEFQRIQTRRSFFRDCAGGLGSIALWHLLAHEGWAGSTVEAAPNANPLAVKPPHFSGQGQERHTSVHGRAGPVRSICSIPSRR